MTKIRAEQFLHTNQNIGESKDLATSAKNDFSHQEAKMHERNLLLHNDW